MSDPYQVLNIAPTATDDEVRHAYRELARKYHPDNYHDNPLADLAQEKMKEINEAYELIQKQRKTGGASSSGTQGTYRYDTSYRAASAEALLQRVRAAIDRGDVTLAERLLNETAERGAEWSFLMGVVCSRRGWMDDARQHFETACRLEPDNAEYRNALRMLASGAGYRPAGYRGGGQLTYGSDTCMRLCAAWSCCMLSRGGCFFC